MDRIKSIFDEYGINVSEEQLRKFKLYMNGILEFNSRINLTAITDFDEFVVKHFVDSIVDIDLYSYGNVKSVCDVGTGAGFPGVPLAIMYPDIQFILMDSLNKRLKIVEELCGTASISNVQVVHTRAEDAGRSKNYREAFDVVVSRAVANLSVLSEYCLPLVKRDGYFLSYKGPMIQEELHMSIIAIDKLGGGEPLVKKTSIRELSHNLLVVKKIKSTPKIFPRKAGIPSKSPIC